MIRLRALLLVVVWLSGCATVQPMLTDIEISRVGVINALSRTGRDIYVALSLKKNRNQDMYVNWDFPTMVFDELNRGLHAEGLVVVDLTREFSHESSADDLFKLGYSLKFGLSSHVVTKKAGAQLSTLMNKKDLDVIVVLRPADHNVDAPSWRPHPNSASAGGHYYPHRAFGFYKYHGGLLQKHPQHTFVQIEALVISGDPPKVIAILHASNLKEDEEGTLRRSLFGPELKARFRDQITEVVSDIVDGLGL